MTRRNFLISSFLLIVVISVVLPAQAQRRDYMTEMEIELVRDSQDIDKRIDVLTKMIDRRFKVLGVDVGGIAPTAKESKSWGDLPTGNPSELLSDIRKLLQKAIDDIEDVHEHNENALTQNKKEGLLFPAAVRSLAAAATRYMPVLKTHLEKTTDNKDKGLLLNSIESCEQILEAAKTLPPEVVTDKKKKAKS